MGVCILKQKVRGSIENSGMNVLGPDSVTHSYNPSTWKLGAGGLKSQGSLPRREFKADMGYLRTCLERKKEKRGEEKKIRIGKKDNSKPCAD